MADSVSMRMTGLEAIGRRWEIAGPFLRETIAQVFQKRLTEAVQYARTEHLSGGTTATRLAVHTGRLQQSFNAEVTAQGETVTGRLGFIAQAPSWAWVHEFGATIRPRTARMLAIPLTPEARAAGSPRNFPGATFLQRARTGRLIIFERDASGSLRPQYVLVNEVTIPARPVLAPTVAKYAPLILQDLRQAAAQALGGRA